MTKYAIANVFIGLLAFCLTGMPAIAGEEEGGQLYRAFCSQCHGLTGEGNGVNSPELEVAPRNHTDRGEMSARSDEDLRKAIAEGGRADFAPVLEAIQSTNALEYARDAARREADAAARSIGALPPSVYRDSLLELAAFSVTRRS